MGYRKGYGGIILLDLLENLEMIQRNKNYGEEEEEQAEGRESRMEKRR